MPGAIHDSASPTLAQVTANGQGRAHLDITTRNTLPFPARNQRGEGWGEGHSMKSASFPQRSPPFREEREKSARGWVVVVR